MLSASAGTRNAQAIPSNATINCTPNVAQCSVLGWLSADLGCSSGRCGGLSTRLLRGATTTLVSNGRPLRLGNLSLEGFERNLVWLGSAAHSGVERVDGR